MLICIWLHRRADGWACIDGGNHSWYVTRSFAYSYIGELTPGCASTVETRLYVICSFAYGYIGELTAGCGSMVETIVGM